MINPRGGHQAGSGQSCPRVAHAELKRWRKRPTEERVSAGDQLSHFRSLYDRGEISREEFDRIRTRLGGKMRQELQLPQSPAPPAAPPRDPGPGGNGTGEAPNG